MTRSDASLRQRCDDIRSRVPLSSIAGSALKLRRAGREWKACCPFHPDRTPSFTIYADDGRFMCFGCGAEGDVLDFVMRLHRIRLTDAIEMLDTKSVFVVSPNRHVSDPSERTSDRGAEARAIWDAALPAVGTPADAYLRSRGISAPLPESIRYAMLTLGRLSPMPALVAAASSLRGEVTGIQRTFLAADGLRKARLAGGTAKLSLGRVRGSAIRLGPAARELIVTEGLEDGLSLLQLLGRPVWVAAGATMLPSIQLPDIVEHVVIGADNDEAGRAAAHQAAEAFKANGKRVRIMAPDQPYKDFNDWLGAQGAR